MAYALVGTFGTVATGSTSCAPTFAQTTTANNLLVCWLAGAAGNFTGLTGWTQAVTSGNSNGRADVWYKVAAGSDSAPTATFTGGTNCAGCLAEFSGGPTTSLVDTTAGGAVATSPLLLTTAGNLAANGELICSSDVVVATKAGTDTTTDTYNNGATPTTNRNNDATSIITHYRFAWGTATTSGAAETNSITSASMNLSLIGGGLAAFNLPAAAPASLVIPTTVPTYRNM